MCTKKLLTNYLIAISNAFKLNYKKKRKILFLNCLNECCRKIIRHTILEAVLIFFVRLSESFSHRGACVCHADGVKVAIDIGGVLLRVCQTHHLFIYSHLSRCFAAPHVRRALVSACRRIGFSFIFL